MLYFFTGACCPPEPPFIGGEGSLEWLERDPSLRPERSVQDDIFGEEWMK